MSNLKMAAHAAILAFIAPAFGQEALPIAHFVLGPDWSLTTESVSGDLHFMHTPSIVKDGNIFEVWEVTDYKEPQMDSRGKTYHSSKSLSKYDCKKRTIQLMHRTTYSDKAGWGEIVDTIESENFKPGYVAPDTVGYTKLKALCAKPISKKSGSQ